MRERGRPPKRYYALLPLTSIVVLIGLFLNGIGKLWLAHTRLLVVCAAFAIMISFVFQSILIRHWFRTTYSGSELVRSRDLRPYSNLKYRFLMIFLPLSFGIAMLGSRKETSMATTASIFIFLCVYGFVVFLYRRSRPR